MNIELIEMITRGRADLKSKKVLEPAKPLVEQPSRKHSNNKSINPETAKDLATAQKKKDEALGVSIEHSDGEQDEEEYLNRILNDNQYLVDLSAADYRHKKYGTFASIGSLDAREQGPTDNQKAKIKEQEQARQDSLFKLFNQVVLDKVLKEEQETGKPFQQIINDHDAMTNFKLDCIRGFKGLQYLKASAHVVNDNNILEEMYRLKLKRNQTEAKVKSLMGNHLSIRGVAGAMVSQSLISLSSQLNMSSEGREALPPSRLMDLNRRNKLLSTHETLHDQINQCARYLYSSRTKLEKLTLVQKGLVEAYKIKKEEIVERLRRINKAMKKLRERNDAKLLARDDTLFSPIKKTKGRPKEFNLSGLSKIAQAEKEEGNSELNSPNIRSPTQAGSFFNSRQSNGVNGQVSSLNRSPTQISNISLLDESIDEEMFGEGAKEMVKRILGTQSNNSSPEQNNEVIYEILKGDLKRTKLMAEKQLEELMEHQRESLSMKKDYLTSLAKYVMSLEDTLQKTKRKQRNMFLFLLEHPKDIT